MTIIGAKVKERSNIWSYDNCSFKQIEYCELHLEYNNWVMLQIACMTLDIPI